MPVGGGLLDIVVCMLLSYRWSCDPGLMFIWYMLYSVIVLFLSLFSFSFRRSNNLYMGCWVLLYLTESTTVQVDDVHVVSIVYA